MYKRIAVQSLNRTKMNKLKVSNFVQVEAK